METVFCLFFFFFFFCGKSRPGRGKLLPILAEGWQASRRPGPRRIILGLDACVASGLVSLLAALFLPGTWRPRPTPLPLPACPPQQYLVDLPMVFCTGVLVKVIFYLV